MTEGASLGVRRLRQAIANQATCGSGQLELSIDSADRLCRECEGELARFAWANCVPVPKDADGNVVPLDTTELYTDEGEMVCVWSISFNRYFWHVRRLGDGRPYRLDRLHRTEQDSWEKLEEDIQKVAESDVCGYFDKESKPCGDCPARRTQDKCASVALQDVMRRAKALAERDAKASAPQSSPHEAKEANRD